ncbi:coat protein [ssRNA phage Gerhypos.2_6]|uniref:Coat protein n=2 Tax=Fiersviridae TaxID=2842319 RepID=A0A8S5KY50_9VIRU|nr:coat protein [ssRNA phage Gerhypos.2_6]QDH90643.1 MAG: hypothetical protein H2Bulk34280_000003 [Leviviridae sp.]DAD50047.1 TPA_asm: coat protein [ssRNA phage Gerhypos.2_6]
MQTNVAIGVGAVKQLTMQALGINGNLATWKDTAVNSGVPIGFPTLTISNRHPTAQIRSYKAQIKLAVPYLATLGTTDDGGYVADPKVSYVNLANVELVFSDKATLANRQDMAKYLKDLFGDAGFLDGLIESMTLSFDATLEAHA